MKELIRKEITLTKGYLLVVLLFPILSAMFLFFEKDETYILFSFMISTVTTMAILNIMGEERSAKMDSLFLSLPVIRDNVVKSKYLVYGLLPIIYSVLLYVSTYIANLYLKTEDININVDFVLLSSSISLIIVAIIIPILFKWNSKYKVAYMVIHLLFASSSIIFNYDLFRVDLNFQLLSMVLFIISIVVYLVSYRVSKRLYRKISFQE